MNSHNAWQNAEYLLEIPHGTESSSVLNEKTH